MKNTLRLAVLFSVCGGLALVSPAPAHGQGSGLYLKTDVGGNLTSDTDLKEFFGSVPSGTKVKFDPGFRFGVAAGYEITDWFAAEGEVGIMANNISSITDASRVDASFSNFPFLLNAKFQWPGHYRLTPYIGAGVGCSVAVLDANEISVGNVTMSGTESSDAIFAYQAFAGLRYRITENMDLGVEFRYFATDAPKWHADFTIDTDTNAIRFGDVQTYALSLTFEFRF